MFKAIVIGGGPAGLMAAEELLKAGIAVDLYDAMPSVGRKFLMAGKGGLNITHAEDMAAFIGRYGVARDRIAPWLAAFGPTQLRAWIEGLGISTFVGTSGRVFPAEMKAAPLLRAWLHRLRGQGLRLHMRHRWLGWDDQGALRFASPHGEMAVAADATILAVGGGSWPQLGSDGAWADIVAARHVEITPLRPSNCGFDLEWSGPFAEKHAGAPVKNIAASFGGIRRAGECIVTATGIEGGVIYTLSAALRDAIAAQGEAILELDLLPQFSTDRIAAKIARPRGSRSLSSHLKSRLRLDTVKAGLIRECLSSDVLADPARLAAAIKALPFTLHAARPLAEAISSAGGVKFSSLSPDLMLLSNPGVYCAGEMLDWEAPTGGYLLTACFASGKVAGSAAARWLSSGHLTRI